MFIHITSHINCTPNGCIKSSVKWKKLLYCLSAIIVLLKINKNAMKTHYFFENMTYHQQIAIISKQIQTAVCWTPTGQMIY